MAEFKTGAEIVWEYLLWEGVEVVFGYPGGNILPIYGALHWYHDRIPHILARHEQGATHMADGYARVSGRVGVVMATSGPGATNMVTGLHVALKDAVPLVCITGQVPSTVLGGDAFQEVDMSGIVVPVTKHSYVVTDITELVQTLRDAFHIARTGRPGPVLVDICKDVQNARTEFGDPGRLIPTVRPDPPDEQANGYQSEPVEAALLPVTARSPLLAQALRQIHQDSAGQALLVTETPHSQALTDYDLQIICPSGAVDTLGFSLPAAIGASIHLKEREVWVVLDDGSMQMALKELAAAVQERANIKILLSSDGYLGMQEQLEHLFGRDRYPGRLSLDYVKLAEAYRLPAYRVDSPAGVIPALQQARACPGPVLLEFAAEPAVPALASAEALTTNLSRS